MSDKQNKASACFLIMERYESRRTAHYKAPADICRILSGQGAHVILIRSVHDSSLRKRLKLDHAYKLMIALGNWIKIIFTVKRASQVLLQYPFQMAPIAKKGVRWLQRHKRCQVITLVHDLETLRQGVYQHYNQRRSERVEWQVLPIMDRVIVHTVSMKRFMQSQGMDENKLVVLGLFDYLTEAGFAKTGYGCPIVVAGNLAKEKSGYIYPLLELLGAEGLHLYGVNFSAEAAHSSAYMGQAEPDLLPEILAGSFGLVWDGSALETCNGNTGVYLQWNSPHKLSLYLAAGLPVIIWSGAAQATFVREQDVGITVNNLCELRQLWEQISPERYSQLCINAQRVGMKLRNGEYTLQALRACRT